MDRIAESIHLSTITIQQSTHPFMINTSALLDYFDEDDDEEDQLVLHGVVTVGVC